MSRRPHLVSFCVSFLKGKLLYPLCIPLSTLAHRTLYLGSLLMLLFRPEGKNQKGKASFQRSEEVGAAVEMKNRLTRQPSKDSTDGSVGSISSDSSNA